MPGSATELNTRYLHRSRRKCNGYLGSVSPERKVNIGVQAVNGRCQKCGYRLAWVVVRGKNRKRNQAHDVPKLARLM